MNAETGGRERGTPFHYGLWCLLCPLLFRLYNNIEIWISINSGLPFLLRSMERENHEAMNAMILVDGKG